MASNAKRHISLLRGYKTRLLRAPLRLPWETTTIPLEASPRFLPALVHIRTDRGDVEVSLGPGPPLSRKLQDNSVLTKITYADGALLGSAALFSVFLSGAALTALALGTKHAKKYLVSALGEGLTRDIGTTRGDFGVFVDTSGEAVGSPRSDKDAEIAFESWLRRFSPLQKELIGVLAKHKTDKRWLPDKRPRELVRAFRVRKIAFYPELDGEKEKEIKSWLGEHLGAEKCRLTRPYKRGYAKSHGGLARKIYKTAGGGEAEDSLETLVFSACRIGNKPLFYSDLGSHLEQYALTDKENGLGVIKTMAAIVGGGDFIRMPLLWWGPDRRPGYPHIQFYGDACRASRVLRATLLSLFGLLFDAAVRGLQSSRESNNKRCLGNARLLFEAALAHLYYALSSENVAFRAKVVVGVAEHFTRIARGNSAWKELSVLLKDHSWEGHWTLAETTVFASRVPLPSWYQRELHRLSIASAIRQLREGLQNIGLYG